jgi:hypothetical protein
MGRVKESYPFAPGYRELTTSRDAAKFVADRADILRDRVLTAIRNAGPAGLTADQCASRIGETVLAVRPRVTELKWAGKIETTGERRANASGAKAAVWRVKVAS